MMKQLVWQNQKMIIIITKPLKRKKKKESKMYWRNIIKVFFLKHNIFYNIYSILNIFIYK